MSDAGPRAVIVDYGMGNLYSVKNACRQVGLAATISAEVGDVEDADALILPGIGAFGDAMANLRSRGLVDPILRHVAAGKPLMGVCLGLQLLMTESLEFGRHQGLGIIAGDCVRLESDLTVSPALKVPHVAWNQVRPAREWKGTLLQDVTPGDFMYFVHSFYVRPADSSVVLSATRYGAFEFCSSIQQGTVFACQFHPERSGPAGLRIYAWLRQTIQSNMVAAGRSLGSRSLA